MSDTNQPTTGSGGPWSDPGIRYQVLTTGPIRVSDTTESGHDPGQVLASGTRFLDPDLPGRVDPIVRYPGPTTRYPGSGTKFLGPITRYPGSGQKSRKTVEKTGSWMVGRPIQKNTFFRVFSSFGLDPGSDAVFRRVPENRVLPFLSKNSVFLVIFWLKNHEKKSTENGVFSYVVARPQFYERWEGY